MQHFILPGTELTGLTRLELRDKDVLHQMSKVLRFKAGDVCIVLDGQGTKAKGEIQELHRKGAVIKLSEHTVCPAPKRRVRLYCALSKKPSTFELIVQKATELGVTDIIPLLTERCQVSELRKGERLEAIVREACEQSERNFLPKLHPTLPLKQLSSKGLLLAGDARLGTQQISDMKLEGDINLVIGPEGGLTDEELEALKTAGAKIFILGDTVLRMETAAIASLSLIQFC
jgi:16S rRNA (uracil1498-N3)-methyltransferase